MHDQQAIKWLVKISSRPYLAPFLGRECTVTEAATMLERNANQVLRWVQRFVACGLLIETRTSRRAGSAIRYYQAVASEFRIPVTALPMATLMETDNAWHQRFQNGLFKLWLQTAQDDLPRMARVFLNDNHVSLGLSEGASEGRIGDADTTVVSNWTPLRLSSADAQALGAELKKLEARYRTRATPNETPYLLRLALAPLENS